MQAQSSVLQRSSRERAASAKAGCCKPERGRSAGAGLLPRRRSVQALRFNFFFVRVCSRFIYTLGYVVCGAAC